MFNTIAEVKRANREAGFYFFSPDTMRFFASRIESGLYKNQCFITSEKRCFSDDTRVFKVRRARPDGSIENMSEWCDDFEEAREIVRGIK